MYKYTYKYVRINIYMHINIVFFFLFFPQWWSPSGDVDQLVMRHLDIENGVPMALMYEVRDVLGVCAYRYVSVLRCVAVRSNGSDV